MKWSHKIDFLFNLKTKRIENSIQLVVCSDIKTFIEVKNEFFFQKLQIFFFLFFYLFLVFNIFYFQA